MRISVTLALIVAALAGTTSAARSADPGVGAITTYLVQPDLRLCPSPLCGGAWVQRANHSITWCADGGRANRCYVASVSGGVEIVRDTLVRGRLVPAGLAGHPRLGRLSASKVWRPLGAAATRGALLFRVRDTGVRCVTHPCFSFVAAELESARRVTLSDLDLTLVGASAEELAWVRKALPRAGVVVAGSLRIDIEAGPAGDGRTLVATQLWRPVG